MGKSSATAEKDDRIISNASVKFAKAGINIVSGELWTARQRQMHPMHYTVSYRASFKPELPAFFINKFLRDRGVRSGMVLDPFGGRGTTAIQANLMGYGAVHNDLNPVSRFLAKSRQIVPSFESMEKRLESMDLESNRAGISRSDRERLNPFFHPKTLNEILNFRNQLLDPANKEDPEMMYLGVTALSRLYGHSQGFFSVYTFPQISIMPGAQRRNNERRGQNPDYRGIKERIIAKLRRDLKKPLPGHYHNVSVGNIYSVADVRNMRSVATESVDLIVTSPPFLDKVDYLQDNWMRSWFLGLENEVDNIQLGLYSEASGWENFMKDAMLEMGRVLKPGARAVIEVGEVRTKKGILPLEDLLIGALPLDVEGGKIFAEEVYINTQRFTKLAHCWDVKNNTLGTNTNRCLVIQKRN